ncbi:hypothetical protein Tco_0319244 [Tanacetum coccineum]
MGRGTWYYSLGVFLEIVDVFVRSEFEISSWRGARVDVRTYLLGGAIDSSEANGIIRDPKLELESSRFTFDLVPLSYESVDVVVGENWLLRHKAEMDKERRRISKALSCEVFRKARGWMIAGVASGKLSRVEGIKLVMTDLGIAEGADEFHLYYDARSKEFEAAWKRRMVSKRWLCMMKDMGSCGSKADWKWTLSIKGEAKSLQVDSGCVVKVGRVKFDKTSVCVSKEPWDVVDREVMSKSVIIREVFVKLLLKSSGKLSIRYVIMCFNKRGYTRLLYDYVLLAKYDMDCELDVTVSSIEGLLVGSVTISVQWLFYRSVTSQLPVDWVSDVSSHFFELNGAKEERGAAKETVDAWNLLSHKKTPGVLVIVMTLSIHFSILYIDTMCCDDIHSCLHLAFLPWRGVTIEGFSKIAKSMTKLTQKNVKFDWGEKEKPHYH